MQRGGVPNPTAPAPFPPNPAFATAAQFPALQAQQAALPALSNPGNIASLISTLDGPTLQSLLGALQQQQRPAAVQSVQQPFPAAPAVNQADLASLLNQATRQQNPVPALQVPPQRPLPGQPFGLPIQNPPVVPDPNLMSLLAKGLGGQQPQPQPQNPAAIGPQVQNIVNQLTKWKQ